MVTSQDIEQFIDRLIHLTQQELNYESTSTPSISSSSLTSLSKSGLALLNLSSTSTEIGLGGKTIIQLERSIAYHNTVTFPPHDFRPGDVARLLDMSRVGGGGGGGKKGKGKEKEGEKDEAIEGVVYKVLDNKVLIALGKGGRVAQGEKKESQEEDDLEIPTRIALLKVSNPTTFLRQIQALEKLKKIVLPPPPPPSPAPPTSLLPEVATTNSKVISLPPPEEGAVTDATATLSLDATSSSDSDSDSPTPPPPAPTPNSSISSPPSPTISPLISLLLGLTSLPLPPPSPSSSPPTTYFNTTLNPSQKSTIQFILHSTSPIGLIWGPPGTGKTSTVVEIIRQLVLKEGKRVLVCGGSNLSVDGILEKLMRPLENENGEEVEVERMRVTRIGHPARVLNHLTNYTLDSQSLFTETSSLLSDIKSDLRTLEGKLNGGVSGIKKEEWRGRKNERKKLWEEVRELRRDYKRREKGVVGSVLKEARVVLCTTHGAGSRLLEKEEPFDVVIIDEAAQVTEPSCWIPILKGKRLILAGDHLQLPPTIKSLNSSTKEKKEKKPFEKEEKKVSNKDENDGEDAPTLKLPPSPSLELTLFSRLLELHGPSIRRMLNVQYRFNEKIMDFPSKTLYEGELRADDSVKERNLVDLVDVDVGEEGERGEVDEDLKEEVIFYDTAGAAMFERSAGDDSTTTSGKTGGDGSKSNENEANLVLKHIESLIQAGLPRTAIAVISPYNAQVSLIASLVHPTYPEIEVGSIDSWQGREQEVVIISLVRSNEKGDVGFLKEKRRLNVAMTRPKRQLVVVGDSHTVKQGGSYLKSWMEWLEENAYVVPVS